MDMNDQETKDAIQRLIDEKDINWISDITSKEYYQLSRLAVRAEIFDDDLLRKIVETKLSMAPSRESHRVDQIIEFAQALDSEGIPPEEAIDAFGDSGNVLTQAEGEVEKA